jgi:hypothetical protein
MKELSIELRNIAREAGLCDQWFGEWNDDSDNATLFDKYKRGIDFCIEHGYPTNEYIKSHWDKEMLIDNNIFVDDKNVELESPKGTVIINGDSDILTYFRAFDTADIYLRHTSKLKIIARWMSCIMVNVYDNAEVEIDAEENAKVYVYRHSDNCKVTSIGEKEPIVRTSIIK